jgi:hypothetical protein
MLSAQPFVIHSRQSVHTLLPNAAERSFPKTLDLDRSPRLFEGSLDLLDLVPPYALLDVLWRALDEILRSLQPGARVAHRLGPPASMLSQISRKSCEANGARFRPRSTTQAIWLAGPFTLSSIATSSVRAIERLYLQHCMSQQIGPTGSADRQPGGSAY